MQEICFDILMICGACLAVSLTGVVISGIVICVVKEFRSLK